MRAERSSVKTRLRAGAVLALACALTACHGPRPTVLVVSAAASLTDALEAA